MKKLLIIALSLILVFSLVACGKKDAPAGNDSSNETPAGTEGKENKEDGDKDKSESKDPEVLRVQLIPSKDAEKLNAQRKPLQDLLQKELGMDVEVTVATDYNGLIEGMKSEKIDVGFLSTTAYVLAKDQGAAEVLISALRYDVNDNGDKLEDKPMVNNYKAQLVANKEANIHSIADLKGKKIAVASFTSTSGFVWPANLLADNDLDPQKDVEWVNVGGHDKAISAVYNGEVDAAFTFKDARFLLEKENPDVREKVLFVMDTEPIPNDTISCIPSLSDDLKERIAQAFINIAKDPEGVAIVREIYSHEGYAKAQDSDYDIVRKYLKRQEEWDF